MRRLILVAACASNLFGLAFSTLAQQTPTAPQPDPAPVEQPADDPDKPAPIPFEGGSFTIIDADDGQKVLAYDGQEIARNYVVYFDRTVTLGEVEVALFDVGDGGNQCGPATIIAQKVDGELQTDTVGEDCGAPPAAATADSLYFVPYLTPGETGPVQVWQPSTGLRVAGSMSFVPQPGTSWKDLETARLDNIVDAFDNEAVYRAASKLLANELNDFATGLLTGGGTERTVNGTIYGSGCVPHACGSADAFMAVDTRGRKLYLAQTGEHPEPKTWPALKTWPADMRSAMKAALGPQQ